MSSTNDLQKQHNVRWCTRSKGRFAEPRWFLPEWMDAIALESTVCTLKTLITLPPQLIFNYALKVLQQTGQPILDILVRKVYRVNILAGPLHLWMRPTESIFTPKMEINHVGLVLPENHERQRDQQPWYVIGYTNAAETIPKYIVVKADATNLTPLILHSWE